VPLAAWLAGASRGWRRLALWGIIAAYGAAIFVTFSRGGLLGLLAVFVLYGLRRRNVVVRAAMAGILVVCAICVVFFWKRSEGFTDLSDFTLQQRITTMRTGIRMFLDRPLLGVGLGGSVAAFPLYAPEDVNFRESLVTHNTMIQALSEVGVIGCGLFTALVSVSLYHALRRRRWRPARWSSADESGDAASGRDDAAGPSFLEALGLSLCGFLVCGLFGPYVLSWFPYILMALVSAGRAVFEGPAERPGSAAGWAG
jgi:O-antigen ligase